MASSETALEEFRIQKMPRTICYIPEFITASEEKYLLEKVYSAPKPKWTQLAHRRLQNWGGLPHPKGMVSEKIPEWLDKYISRIHSLNIFDGKRPNHVLVNEYIPGQGIMPHKDGPLFYPVITTINLGSHVVLDYYHPADEELYKDGEQVTSFEDRYFASILMKPRSLLIVKDDMYHHFLHGIREVEEDVIQQNIANHEELKEELGSSKQRQTRISLTIRHVPKTLKINLKIGH